MAGRGFLAEAAEIDATRIKTLRNGRWVPMFRPINPDRRTSGVNLAESFAEAFARDYDADVGLICCADGGTRLDQWKKGEVLFDHAVFQAKLAQRTSVLTGILWHQGEGDCHDGLYETYEPRMKRLIADFRAALGDVPFLVGGLGDYLAEYPLADYPLINRALEKTAKETPRTAFVSAEGLSSNPDHLHFSAAALYEFGLRYYRAFRELAPNLTDAEKPLEEGTIRDGMEQL